MDIADRIINIMEKNMYNLNNWNMQNNYIKILKNPKSKYNSYENLFDFSNNGKEIINIKLDKNINVPRITTV